MFLPSKIDLVSDVFVWCPPVSSTSTLPMTLCTTWRKTGWLNPLLNLKTVTYHKIHTTIPDHMVTYHKFHQQYHHETIPFSLTYVSGEISEALIVEFSPSFPNEMTLGASSKSGTSKVTLKPSFRRAFGTSILSISPVSWVEKSREKLLPKKRQNWQMFAAFSTFTASEKIRQRCRNV